MPSRYPRNLADYPVATALEEALQLSGALAMVVAAARNMLSDGRIDETNIVLERAAAILDDEIGRLQDIILRQRATGPVERDFQPSRTPSPRRGLGRVSSGR